MNGMYPCLNGGHCVSWPEPEGYKCECFGNYTGRNCERGKSDGSGERCSAVHERKGRKLLKVHKP